MDRMISISLQLPKKFCHVKTFNIVAPDNSAMDAEI